MMLSHNFFTSSIGKKQVMALTGIGLLGFTLTHLLGNLLILVGPDVFNKYAHALTSNQLIYFAEAGLLGLFLLHIVLAVVLKIENNLARPQKYYVRIAKGKGENIASKTMPYTGVILLIFIILHLINFKYGSNYSTTVDGMQMRDIYRTVIEYFANPAYVAWYVFAMFALGLHTSHGLQSAFQSIGLRHPKYSPIVETLSIVYGVFVAIGFSALAVYSHFQN